MRRRLQESFHFSPSANGGFFGGLGAHPHSHGSAIPSISVSVQTEPTMPALNGNLANTATPLANGGTSYSTGNGGLVNGNLVGGGGGAGGWNNNGSSGGGVGGQVKYSAATLPHTHHYSHSNAVAGGGVGGGVVSTEAETVGVTNPRNWSRDNLLAASYRDVRDASLTTFPNSNMVTSGIAAITSHSRDNTLNREIHHLTVRVRD